MDLVAILQGAIVVAHEHAQARFLQNVHVVIVGVAHGPATRVAASILTVERIHKFGMSFGPFLKIIVFRHLSKGRRTRVQVIIEWSSSLDHLWTPLLFNKNIVQT